MACFWHGRVLCFLAGQYQNWLDGVMKRVRTGRIFLILLVVMLLAVFLLPADALAAGRKPLTVLLLGTDQLGDLKTRENQVSRADAMFLLTLRPDTRQVRVLSIERDYLVELPDGHGENKLATATFFGGPEMALESVNQLFNLDISLYAQIELKNLVDALNAIGGLDIYIEEDELEGINQFISGIAPFDLPLIPGPGMNHLDGNQAWAFMASREMIADSVGSNQQRSSRQMRIIDAGVQKLRTMSSRQIARIMDQLLPLVHTNLSLYDLMILMVGMMKADLQQTAFRYSPITPFSVKVIRMHRVVVVEDMSREVELVHNFLYH